MGFVPSLFKFRTMIKTYKANTNVSINVVLASKKNLHISFVPLSDGSSTFTTGNEDIMKAIESHYNFGKLFRLHKTVMANAECGIRNAELGVRDEELDKDSNVDSGKSAELGVKNEELEKVTVSDYGAAKDYLADKFGVSRTAMRSVKAITEQALAHGIEFDVME